MSFPKGLYTSRKVRVFPTTRLVGCNSHLGAFAILGCRNADTKDFFDLRSGCLPRKYVHV